MLAAVIMKELIFTNSGKWPVVTGDNNYYSYVNMILYSTIKQFHQNICSNFICVGMFQIWIKNFFIIFKKREGKMLASKKAGDL